MNADQISTPLEAGLPDVVSCDGSDLNFGLASSVQANTPEDEALQAAGWLWFNNIGVNNETGVRLYQGETPLRANQIQVFPSDVSWRYGFSFATAIREPLGKKLPTPSDWRYPGMARYGLVLFQPDPPQIKAWKLISSTVEAPQHITLDPNQDIFINVNDAKGSYGDNSGSLDVFIKILS